MLGALTYNEHINSIFEVISECSGIRSSFMTVTKVFSWGFKVHRFTYTFLYNPHVQKSSVIYKIPVSFYLENASYITLRLKVRTPSNPDFTYLSFA